MVERDYYIEIATCVESNRDILNSLLSKVRELGTSAKPSRPTKYNLATAQINSIQFVFYPDKKKYITLGDRFADFDNRGRVHEHHIVLLVAWYYTEHPEDADAWHKTNIQQKLSDRSGRKPVYTELPVIKNKAEFEALFSKVEESIDYQPSSQQPILIVPPTPKEDEYKTHYYSHRALKIIGRDEEQEILKKFAGNKFRSGFKPGFKWMQLAGEGGQGKSRLALELADDLKDTWNAGFISTNELDTFQDKWRDWNPDQPTLIIVDYIIADMKYLKKLIYYLSLRKDEFPFPVRLLLLERQRWDHSGAPASYERPSDRPTFSMGLDSSLADWFTQISGKKQERDTIDEAKADPDVTVLEALCLTELTQLTKEWTKEVRNTIGIPQILDFPPDDRIEEYLERIDETGRPLFAYFLGEALAHGNDVTLWELGDLLDATLKRDIKYRWRHYFDDNPPSFEDNHPALKLAVLATMIREVDSSILSNKHDWKKCGPRIRKQARVITDRPISGDDPDDKIRGLLPDLLGEWFIVNAVDANGIPIEEIILAGWQIAPNEMAACLARLSRDFTRHKGTITILEQKILEMPEIEIAFNIISPYLISNLLRTDAKIPSHLIKTLEAMAKSGDADSMSNIGYLYMIGAGGVQDFDKAFEWFKAGSKAGSARAMANLSYFYTEGLGTVKDAKSAFFWCKKGAELGDEQAITNLGFMLFNGIGVEKMK